jgi:hypothetical protein
VCTDADVAITTDRGLAGHNVFPCFKIEKRRL